MPPSPPLLALGRLATICRWVGGWEAQVRVQPLPPTSACPLCGWSGFRASRLQESGLASSAGWPLRVSPGLSWSSLSAGWSSCHSHSPSPGKGSVLVQVMWHWCWHHVVCRLLGLPGLAAEVELTPKGPGQAPRHAICSMEMFFQQPYVWGLGRAFPTPCWSGWSVCPPVLGGHLATLSGLSPAGLVS